MSKIAGGYMYHKKFAWISTRIDNSQDNMVPTVDSNISNINECLNADSHSNPLNDKPFSSETQSEMISQPAADVPLDFSVRNSNSTEQPQDERNESKERIEFHPKTPKSEPEDFSTPDKALDKNMYNGNSSPGHINGRSQFSTPCRNSMDGFSSASHNSDIRLQNSPTHLENGRGIHSVPGVYFTPENGQRINAFQYEQLLQKRYMEHSEQLKISTENGREVNGISLHEGEPSSSPTRSSSLSLESSPPHRNSGSILEEVLAGKQGEKSYLHGMYPSAENHNLRESNVKSLQLTHSTPNTNINLSTRLPRASTEANRSFPMEAVPLSNSNAAAALGFATSVSPLDVNPIMPGINSLIPMTNPLISPTSFPLHNALASGTLNGMNPFLMSSLNSRLPQIGSGGDRKSGKPLRPFKALAGELLFGMAQRVPMSHALYPGYNVTGFTNGAPDPLRSNVASKKEVPRESEKNALNIASNHDTQTAAGTSNSNDSNGSHNEVNGCNMEPVESSNSSNRKRSRLPDDQKDEAYWERRRKNNEAAKRSRDARRVKEDIITHTACALSQENLKLSLNLRRLQEDNGNMLLQIKSLVEEKQRMDVQMQILKSDLMSMMCWKCGSRYSEGHDKNGD